MLDAFNDSYNVKRIFPSGRRGIITLIPKAGKDITKLAHWRPIILLGTDYKILSKAIANRIKSTLDGIISKEQNGFLAGRKHY